MGQGDVAEGELGELGEEKRVENLIRMGGLWGFVHRALKERATARGDVTVTPNKTDRERATASASEDSVPLMRREE